MGKYMMYYCTTSTWNVSNLCFGVSDSVEGPYIWQAPLIYSGFDKGISAARMSSSTRTKHGSKTAT